MHLVSGIDFRTLSIRTVFRTVETELRLTQIGKECYCHCTIFHRAGTCIMPHEGVFAEVPRGGTVTHGEVMTVVPPGEELATYNRSET